jgi:tetratricopeptide (TPR) repeat protein
LGESYEVLGEVLAQMQRREEAMEALNNAIEILEALRSPQQRRARRPLRDAHWWKANLLGELNRVGDAAVHWDRAAQLNDSTEHEPYLRHKRAWAWVHAGEYAKTLAEVGELEKLGRFEDFSLQDLAVLCAISAAKIAKKKTTPGGDEEAARPYADRAMELLRKAVAGGYDDLAALKGHADWAALRWRGDFQSLLREIEGRRAKAKKTAQRE